MSKFLLVYNRHNLGQPNSPHHHVIIFKATQEAYIQYRTILFNNKKNSAGADGGLRSRVCARLTLRSAPHQHQMIFFGARFWAGGLKKMTTWFFF